MARTATRSTPKKASSKPSNEKVGTKVFVSWSGERSKPAAEAFRNWLAEKIPRSKPWISSLDIQALGDSAWRNQVMAVLESCQICVSFLTEDNLQSRWLHFEAGAVAQRMHTGGAKMALVMLDVGEPLVA